MKDIDELTPWDIIVEVLKSNGYTIGVIAENAVMEVGKGTDDTCLLYIDCLTIRLDKLDDMFVRIESEHGDKNWIPLGLHDPHGFDEMLKQLDDTFANI